MRPYVLFSFAVYTVAAVFMEVSLSCMTEACGHHSSIFLLTLFVPIELYMFSLLFLSLLRLVWPGALHLHPGLNLGSLMNSQEVCNPYFSEHTG